MRALALALLAVGTILAGCTERDREADLVFVVHDEHHTLDPQKFSWVHDRRIVDALFEPLVRVDLDVDRLEPAAAERWETTPDGRTWTFHLRPEARWSNGDPVTAADFLYAWRRALLPDTTADYTQLLFCLEGAEAFFQWRADQLKSVATADLAAKRGAWEQAKGQFERTVGLSAPDAHTLVLRLARPLPYLAELVAFATFMPAHAASVEAASSVREDSGMVQPDPAYWSDPQRLVSNGPYVLRRRRFKRDLLLAANPHYWNRAAIANRAILEKIIKDPQTALLDYQRGGSDWLPDLPTAAPLAADLVAQQRDDVHVTPMAGVYFYNFNCQPNLPDGSPNPLHDRRVRQALSLAIDRQTLVEQVTRLRQPVVRSFVPPGVLPAYDPPADAGLGFDPALARARLAEAGYPDGQHLAGLSILYNTGFGHEKIAQAIKRMWKEHLNLVVVLEGVEGQAFGERLDRRQFTICRASWFGDYRDPTTFLDKRRIANGNNNCGYENVAYDALLDRAAGLADPVQRLDTLRAAEALMLADSPMAMLFQYLNLNLYDARRVQGLTPNAWAAWRLERVRVSPPSR